MGRRWGRRTAAAATMVAAVLLTSCGGDGASAGTGAASRDTSRATTTRATAPTSGATTTTGPTAAAATATATSTPPAPYSFDGSVPAPPLHTTTGDDAVAALRRLDDYLWWMFSHTPDPALVAEITWPQSELSRVYADDVVTLADRGLRLYESGGGIASAEVVSLRWDDLGATRVGSASLRVEYAAGERHLVDPSGTIVETKPVPAHRKFVVLSGDPNGRWYFSDAWDVPPDVVVEL